MTTRSASTDSSAGAEPAGATVGLIGEMAWIVFGLYCSAFGLLVILVGVAGCFSGQLPGGGELAAGRIVAFEEGRPVAEFEASNGEVARSVSVGSLVEARLLRAGDRVTVRYWVGAPQQAEIYEPPPRWAYAAMAVLGGLLFGIGLVFLNAVWWDSTEIPEQAIWRDEFKEWI